MFICFKHGKVQNPFSYFCRFSFRICVSHVNVFDMPRKTNKGKFDPDLILLISCERFFNVCSGN